jgi:hypothetical protein
MGKLKQVVMWGITIAALGTAVWGIQPRLAGEQEETGPALLASEPLRPAPAEAASLPWCVDTEPDPAQPPPDSVVYLQFNLPLLYLRQQPANADEVEPVPPEEAEPPLETTVRTHI